MNADTIWFKQLLKPEYIKRQLAVQIYYSGMFRAFHQSYWNHLCALNSKSNANQASFRDNPKNPTLSYLDVGDSSPDSRISYHPPRSESARPDDLKLSFARLGFEPMNQWLKYYRLLSNFQLTYIITKFIVDVGTSIVESHIPHIKHVNCYLLGRIEPLANDLVLLAVQLSIGHLAWRFAQRIRQPPVRMDAVVFLLQDESIIKRQHHLVGKTYLDTQDRVASLEDRFVRTIMYYPIHNWSRVTYHLRPNRTESARRALLKVCTLSSILAICVYLSILIGFWPFVLQRIFSDNLYATRYSGCQGQLEGAKENDHVAPESLTTNNYKLVACLADLYENALFWTESICSVIINLALANVINYDLIIYWKDLHQRLSVILAKLRLEQSLDEESEQLHDEFSDTLTATSKVSHISEKLIKTRSIDMEMQTFEIQADICEFFNQIDQADTLISDIITCGVIQWLSTFAIISFMSIKGDAVGALIRMLQLIGVMTFCGISFGALYLQQCASSSYQIICSLMAYDKTMYKRRYTKVLSFFTDRYRQNYTVFRHYPYFWTSFLTIIGWTFSCNILIETSLRANSPDGTIK